jgi:7-keto-8-aminopelargonate synthetase-like enzyme
MAASERARPDYYDYTYDMFLASVEGEKPETTRFSEWIDAACRDGVYSFEVPRLEGQNTEVHVRRHDGTALRLLNFSSYNYLGYAECSRSTRPWSSALRRSSACPTVASRYFRPATPSIPARFPP